MNVDRNIEPEPLSHTDRFKWEKGIFVPRELNKKILDLLCRTAYENGFYDDKILEKMDINFYTKTVEDANGTHPEFRFELTDFRPIFAKKFMPFLHEYAAASAVPIDFDGTKEMIYVHASAPSLRTLVDMLVEGFVKKHNPNLDLNFPKIMEDAAPKGLNYMPGSKNWHTAKELAELNVASDDKYYGIGRQIGFGGK